MDKSLLEQIGGQEALSAVVDKFYEFMIVDPVVNHYFKNTDMVKQAKRQKQFIGMALGGPNNYEGQDMKKAHEKMPIGHAEFDATWANLVKALDHFKVKQELVDQIKVVVYSTEADIVNKK